ncbi:MAG: carbohydrate ABC transporter substrate-binding protein [Actinomycetales bacterium]|nr:carbohydrate ABC transporter substrate-binding protein [Actinomycetales bacterium]
MKKGTRYAAVAATAALAAASLGMGVSAQAATRTVTIFGGYAAGDAAAFQDELDLAFPASSGIKVKYTSLASFDTDITTKIKAGQAPNIAMWPQPGGLIAQKSQLMNVETVLGKSGFAAIKKTLVPGFELLGKSGSTTYGLPVSANLKSIVFYNPAVFKANGWTVPTTQAQLTALQDKIKASGKAYPWCAGTESGGATGWSLTDWMEELVLKTAGVSVYNQWWQGKIKWTDARIVKAGNLLADTLLADGNTQGGGQGVASRFFGLASTQGLFKSAKGDGACAMLKQGSFITGFFPDDIQAELKKKDYTHVGVFAYPGTPNLLGGGDTAAVFKKGYNPAVAKVAAYIMSDKMGTHGYAAKASGFLSPHKTFSPANFADPLSKQFTSMFSKASGFGFDGSDQAPPQVNKTEWSELTNWFAGKITMSQAFKLIADSYNQ